MAECPGSSSGSLKKKMCYALPAAAAAEGYGVFYTMCSYNFIYIITLRYICVLYIIYIYILLIIYNIII